MRNDFLKSLELQYAIHHDTLPSPSLQSIGTLDTFIEAFGRILSEKMGEINWNGWTN